MAGFPQILILWSGTDRQIDQFLKETNAILKDIKFTVEKGNKTINYLDDTLTVKNNRIKYKIYRKPTHKNTTIPRDSFRHPKYKMAATENYYHGAMTVLKYEKEKTKKRLLGPTNTCRMKGTESWENDGDQKMIVLECLGVVSYVRKYTDKVTKALKNLDVTGRIYATRQQW